MPTTKTVELNIIGGRLSIKPEQVDLAPGDSLRFIANANTSAKFEVLFHNAPEFFPGKPRIFSFIIDRNTSQTETIVLPNNGYPLVYYSVCEDQSTGVPQPLPPYAPPRIVIS